MILEQKAVDMQVMIKPKICRDVRVSMRMNGIYNQKIAKISAIVGVTKSTIYNELVENYVNEFEKKHGEIDLS